MEEDPKRDERLKGWFGGVNLKPSPHYELVAKRLNVIMAQEIEEQRSAYVSTYNAAVAAGGGW